MRPMSFSLLLLFATLAIACRHSDADAGSGNVQAQVQRGSDDGASSKALADGDIRIVSIDSAVDLVMIGDTISSGLSRFTLAKVKQEIDTAEVKGSGFSASIEKMVKGTVQGAIGTRVAFPLSAIRDVRYQGGKIEFDWAGKPRNVFTHANVNKKGLLESFGPEESQRFVEAVHARLKSPKNM